MKTLSITTANPLTVMNRLVDDGTDFIGGVGTTATSLGLNQSNDGEIPVTHEVANPLNGDLTDLSLITNIFSSVSPIDTSTSDYSLSVLETAKNSIVVNLQQFAQQADFTDSMALAFGQDVNVFSLQTDWANAEVSFPMIEILPSTEMNHANGAFAGTLNTIYLSEAFVTQHINQSDKIAQVLLEEFGHSLDYQLNAVDSQGDEGAIFSELVLGHTLNATQLNALKAEDDTAVVMMNNQFVEIEQSSTAFQNGVNALFDTLQQSWQSALTGLPLFGNTLQNAEGIIAFFNDIQDVIIDVSSALNDPIGTIETALATGFSTLETEFNNYFSNLNMDVVLDLTPPTIEVTNPQSNELVFELAVGATLTFTNELAADIGLPNLGLSINDSSAEITLNCNLNLNFGLDDDQFYFDTEPTDDLTMSLTASLPELDVTGTLGMLQLQIKDIENEEISLTASMNVDIQDADRGDASDNKTNFSNIDPQELFDVSFGAEADVNLGLTTSFGDDAKFPSISTDLKLGWGVGDSDKETELSFNDVELDLGSFFSDFARPILETVQTVTKPVQPVIDILQQPINLGLTTVSLLDIAKHYSGDKIAPSTWDFIESIADVITLVNAIPTDSNIVIDLGDFNLGNVDVCSQSISDADPVTSGDPEQLVQDQLDSLAPDSKEGIFISKLNSMPGEGLQFPILTDPVSVFKLFLGSSEPIDLFTYDMPTFDFSIETPDFTFPIFGPVVAKFSGQLGATIDLDFGYDTQGLYDFGAHDYQPQYVLDLFNGFYINDYDETGVDKSEVTVSGELKAGAAVDVFIVKAGVDGSIKAEIDFNLNDLTDDGKMRFSDFPSNPLCVFDTSGALTAGLTAYFSAGIWPFEYTKEFNSPRITLISFDGSCNQTSAPLEPPVLAQVNGDYLQLHIGDHATERLRVNTVDGAENFVIQHLSGAAGYEQVLVSASLVDPKAIVQAQQYDAKTMIVANGGAENDIIEFRTNTNGEAVMTPASLTGGAGNDILIGGAGDDVLKGDEGSDKLQGEAGQDVLWGGDDDDFLLGGKDADTLYGDAGDDELDGGENADFMAGGTGNDSYKVDHVNDVVSETSTLESGIDTVQSSISYALGDNVEHLILIGTAAIDGTGNGLANILIGNENNNVLDGLADADAMQGGKGDDSYVVDNIGDVVKEAKDEGKDTVYSSITYTLTDHVEDLVLTGIAAIDGTGNELNNRITGNIAANTLMGLAGDDELDGGQGADWMKGGLGHDNYVVDDVGDKVEEVKDEGHDTVYSSITYTLTDHVEDLVLTGTATINGTGNELDNHITGNSANNTLKGLAGNDVLDGQQGADVMIGGSGDDSYTVDDKGDIVKEYGEYEHNHHHHHHKHHDKGHHRTYDTGGIDTVYASISYALTVNVENLVLMGEEAINGIGNDLDNHLTGNSANNSLEGLEGDDVLDGKAGVDTMKGGSGDDSYTVDNVADVVKECRHDGEDTIYSTVSYTLSDNVENLVLIGTSAIQGFGNALNNHLTGNGAGSILNGQAGHDNYYVSQAGDIIAESAHNGWDTVISSIDYTLEDNLEELYLTGVANLNGTGNAEDNNLNGNAGNNVLDGKAGADWMAGRAGDDTYYVDNTGDQVEERYNEGTDSVYSSVSYRLSANVENLILTGLATINGTGNELNNHLTGNDANNTLRAGGGDDNLVGGNGADILEGEAGQDVYDLTETTPATDTVRIERGDSVINSHDVITGFQLGSGTISTTGVDKLDLEDNHIAHDIIKNGRDVGLIESHHIHDGMISFDDVDHYQQALAITDHELDDVLAYLQDNIKGYDTVAFVCENNTFIFQDNGCQDTLVELVGMTADSLSYSGLAHNAVWIV